MAIGILCCHNFSDYGTKVYTAYSFYSGQILQDARKEAKVTQEELARRTNTTKSYISKVENGVITPSVGVFYRFINALGLRLEVVFTLTVACGFSLAPIRNSHSFICSLMICPSYRYTWYSQERRSHRPR